MRDVPAAGHQDPRRARNVTTGRGGELHEVAEPGAVLRLRVVTERHAVIVGSDDQQRWVRDEVILVADRLLVDHLEGKCRRAGPPRVVRAQGHAHEDVGQRLVDLGVGMLEARGDVGTDDRGGRVG
jgi:hypothetical protein